MSLLVVVLLLIMWGVYGIWNALTPPSPPIENMDEHLKYLMTLKTPAERRKYLRHRKPGDK